MGNPINKFNINGLVRSLLLSFWTILLFCSNLYAGSAIPYIDIGTSTPTANRIVKFDANGKLPDASALSGSVTASQLASDLTLIGTTSGNFNGTHTGSGAALTGVSVAVAFSAVTGSATSAQMPSSPSFPGTMTTTSITIGTTISRNYPFTVYSSVENTINDSLVLGGLATADVEDGGTASSAIDNNSGTYWQATTVLPHYWQYDYGTGNTQRVTRLTLDAYYSGNGRQDKNWALQACNDAVSWGTITTGQDTNAAGVQTYNFSNTSFFRYYKLVFTSTWHTGGSNIAINELQMFPGTEDILTVDSSGNALVGSRLLVGTTTALGTTSANYVIQTGLNQRIVSGGTDVYCFRK